MIVQDGREFAERRIRDNARMKNVVVQSVEPVTIDGLQDYESLAEAVEADSCTPLGV